MSTSMYHALLEKLHGGVEPGPRDYGQVYATVYRNPTPTELDEVLQRDLGGRYRLCAALLTTTGFYVWDRQQGPTHSRVYELFRNDFGPERVPLTVIEMSATTLRLEVAPFALDAVTGFAPVTQQTIQSLVQKHPAAFRRYTVTVKPTYYDEA